MTSELYQSPRKWSSDDPSMLEKYGHIVIGNNYKKTRKEFETFNYEKLSHKAGCSPIDRVVLDDLRITDFNYYPICLCRNNINWRECLAAIDASRRSRARPDCFAGQPGGWTGWDSECALARAQLRFCRSRKSAVE